MIGGGVTDTTQDHVPGIDVPAPEARPPASPFDLPGSWYVIHSYSGYENKVKANLETRIRSMHREDALLEVHRAGVGIVPGQQTAERVRHADLVDDLLDAIEVHVVDARQAAEHRDGLIAERHQALSHRRLHRCLRVVKQREQRPHFAFRHHVRDSAP